MYVRAGRKEVMVMAAADHSGQLPDLYRLLGVSREASGTEITQAWRRKARAEHPDRRPRDAADPARFRALAEAYQVLGDPARRAAYDRSLAGQPGPGATMPGVTPADAPAGQVRYGPAQARVRPAGRAAEPPLRAGPVRVDVPGPAAAVGAAGDDGIRLAALAHLAVIYLAGDWDWPW